jgi:aspartyl-tRNA synthetase
MQQKGLLKLDAHEHKLLWVTDFPLFQHTDDGQLECCHHPFTAAVPEDVSLLGLSSESSTQKRYGLHGEGMLAARGQHYDMVLNGVEIGGGSIRIHDTKMQRHVLENVLHMFFLTHSSS